MKKLTQYEINLLDEALNFSSGWLLNFTNTTFKSFFEYFGINIEDEKYKYHGNSKGKKFRRFLEISEPKKIVEVLNELIFMVEDDNKKQKIKRVIDNIIKNNAPNNTFDINSNDFKMDFEKIKKSLYKFDLISKIIESRLDEILLCYNTKAYFSVIILCGSVLEGLLLNVASKNPKKFNQSNKAPKKQGKVKKFQEWKLSEFIDVAYDIGFLDKVSQKYSHILREFRNYIHPYEAMVHKHFNFDVRSAEISMKVLVKSFEDLEKFI